MNGSNQSRTRIDRAALAATFAATILTLGVSAVAMQPAPALIAAAELSSPQHVDCASVPIASR